MPSRGRRRRRPAAPSLASSPYPAETRDWAALPRDVLLEVFLRLGSREIMRGAVELACTPWRRVAVDEPALWRRVDMATVRLWSPGWRGMVRAAVDRSAGQCVAFAGPTDDYSLLYLVESESVGTVGIRISDRTDGSVLILTALSSAAESLKQAPCLRSLHLLDVSASCEVLTEAIKELKFLEDLELSPSYFSAVKFESVCQACPRLKTLRLRLHMPFAYDLDKVSELPMMWELHSLQLFDCELTADGLKAILDSCPLLESLHVTGSLIGNEMDEDVRQKCAMVSNLTLPDYEPAEEYDPNDYSYWYGL